MTLTETLHQELTAVIDGDFGNVRRAVLRVIYDSSEPPEPERLLRRIYLRRVLRKPCQVIPASFEESRRSVAWVPRQAYRAHCRNISFDGIGLVHDEPVDAEWLVVNFLLDGQRNATFLMQVRWTSLVGTTTRLTGGAFVGVLNSSQETEPRDMAIE